MEAHAAAGINHILGATSSAAMLFDIYGVGWTATTPHFSLKFIKKREKFNGY